MRIFWKEVVETLERSEVLWVESVYLNKKCVSVVLSIKFNLCCFWSLCHKNIFRLTQFLNPTSSDYSHIPQHVPNLTRVNQSKNFNHIVPKGLAANLTKNWPYKFTKFLTKKWSNQSNIFPHSSKPKLHPYFSGINSINNPEIKRKKSLKRRRFKAFLL